MSGVMWRCDSFSGSIGRIALYGTIVGRRVISAIALFPRMCLNFTDTLFHGLGKIVEQEPRSRGHGRNFLHCGRQFLQQALRHALNSADCSLRRQTRGLRHTLPMTSIDMTPPALTAHGLGMILRDPIPAQPGHQVVKRC